MELWNDFEGKVVDDQYRLGRLLAPKGRSAFFTATGPKLEPVSIRLIESLNDEDEILARWRRVRDLHEEHLVQMMACGQTMLDGTHLVYAVLEPTDAELGEVLRERALTVEETRAMAAAVLAGLETLHAAGLVHEHVDAASVLAQGEVIKLRSDCVREAPAGAQGETLRRRDTHDFAMLVGYALTQRRDAMQGMVPRQFEDLVRNGMSGTWGLKEMAALLRPAAATMPAAAGGGAPAVTAGPAARKMPGGAAAPVPHVGSVLPAAVNGSATESVAGRRVPVPGGAATAGPMLVGPRGAGANGAVSLAAAGAVMGTTERAGAAMSSVATTPTRPSGLATGDVATGAVPGRPAAGIAEGGSSGRSYSPAAVASALGSGEEAETLPTRRPAMTERGELGAEDGRRRLLIPLAVLGSIVLLVLLIWFFVRGKTAAPAVGTTNAVAGPAAATPVPAKPSAASSVRPSSAAAQRFARAQAVNGPARPASVPAPATSSPVGAANAPTGTGAAVWRVVAFTYMREEQAQGKVAQIAARHPELKPEVFSPSGRAPYLVALGGWMSAGQAQTERERARRDGMPRDTYAQNYHGR